MLADTTVSEHCGPKVSGKREPTFADAVMTVRRLIWTETVFEQPAYSEGMHKLPADVRDALFNTLTQAI